MDDSVAEQISINIIRNYKNIDMTDDEIRMNYSLGITLLINNLKNSNNTNIKQQSQGSRSVTFKENYSVLDENVKMVLGLPYVRVY
jgi:hypothetical protein